MSFDKLLNVTNNLTKPHVSMSAKQARRFNHQEDGTHPLMMANQQPAAAGEAGLAYKPVDLNYNFIRSLILDNVLEHPILLQAFLENKITNMAQLEQFSRVTYTQRFQALLEKLQSQVKDQKVATERLRELKSLEGKENHAVQNGGDRGSEAKQAQSDGDG